jgi:glycosyltransferase involved in cell wall biosynthesis
MMGRDLTMQGDTRKAAVEPALRVLFWGTYDLGKPRNRILRDGLRQCGVVVDECHASTWEDTRDKGVLSGWQLSRRLLKTLASYPRLIFAFMRAPKPDVVLIGYLGQLDVLLVWPFARLRRVSVVWDQFISLYITAVEDRKLIPPRHLLARALYAWEWLACRAPDRVLMDTQAHASYLARLYRLGPGRVGSVWVGVEPSFFPPRATASRSAETLPTVLFYGQFIPLHGIETIVEATRLLRHAPIRFIFIGSGQDEARIRRLLDEDPRPRVEWIPWVPYEELVHWIHEADVCLGVFGATQKAALVIPNKVFQILAAQRPLITRDSPAIRELLGEDEPGVTLVPPADPVRLATAVERAVGERHASSGPLFRGLRGLIAPRAIGQRARAILIAAAATGRATGSSTT